MKALLRHYFIDTISLYTVSLIATGMVFENGLTTLLITGAALTVGSLLAKPIIGILLLPLNLVTFGIFSWVSSAIVLYLVTLIAPGFRIEGFYFGGLVSKWLDIPQIGVSGWPAYVLYAFLLSLMTSFLYWIRK